MRFVAAVQAVANEESQLDLDIQGNKIVEAVRRVAIPSCGYSLVFLELVLLLSFFLSFFLSLFISFFLSFFLSLSLSASPSPSLSLCL